LAVIFLSIAVFLYILFLFSGEIGGEMMISKFVPSDLYDSIIFWRGSFFSITD